MISQVHFQSAVAERISRYELIRSSKSFGTRFWSAATASSVRTRGATSAKLLVVAWPRQAAPPGKSHLSLATRLSDVERCIRSEDQKKLSDAAVDQIEKAGT